MREFLISCGRAVFALGALLALNGANAADGPKQPIRFGLTAAVVRENLGFYERWAAYLGNKVGRPIKFVQRRTYREAIELLQTGENDFSWICSFPFAEHRDSKFFGLMAVPVFEGQPLYRSYIVVDKDRSFATIADLEDRVFAYSDPDFEHWIYRAAANAQRPRSQSGYLFP